MRAAFQAALRRVERLGRRLGDQRVDRLVERLGRGQRILIVGQRDVGIGRDHRLRIGLGFRRQHEDRRSQGRRRRQRGKPGRMPGPGKCARHACLLAWYELQIVVMAAGANSLPSPDTRVAARFAWPAAGIANALRAGNRVEMRQNSLQSHGSKPRHQRCTFTVAFGSP